MPFVPILVGLLVLGLVVFTLLMVRLRGAVRRFGMVRGWLEDYLTDRTGMLRARTAAVSVMASELRLGNREHGFVRLSPRTIDNSQEREDHRA